MGSINAFSRSTRWRVGAIGLTVGLVALSAACSSSGSGSSSGVSASSKQTITFAESGLGTEGQQTQKAINAFEAANPNIKVNIQVLSSDSTTYLSQLEHDFISGSTTPDVFESDVTYPAKFAQAGWVLSLAQFSPNMSQFFPHEVAAGTFNGTQLRGSVVRQPGGPVLPHRPDQDPADQPGAGGERRPGGLEGRPASSRRASRSRRTSTRARSRRSSPSTPRSAARSTRMNVNTPGNVAALSWLHDAIYKYHIAPTAVTGWQEGQVEQEFVSGYAAFSINYPFVESLATSPPVKGHVGYIPFPAGPGGTPGSALGGEMLAINAKTAHAQAAWKLIEYLTSALGGDRQGHRDRRPAVAAQRLHLAAVRPRHRISRRSRR